MELLIRKRASKYQFFKDFYGDSSSNFKVSIGDVVIFKQISLKFKMLAAASSNKHSIFSTNETGFKMLDLMLQNLHDNNKRKIYDPELKEICLLLFLYGGRMTYNLLSELLPIPKLSSIRRELGEVANVQEGVLRVEELKSFLEKNNLPFDIWISEDATRCVAQVDHDSKEDKFVGFVLPYNDETGMPLVEKYKNITPNVLKASLLSEPKSNYLYTIIAQPLKRGSPSFCLCVYGTNNSFTSEHVHKRFNYVVEALAQVGINVIGWSSDGDSRLLSTMKKVADLSSTESDGVREEFKTFYFSKMNAPVSPIQDPEHLKTKMRNWVIQPSSPLRIGKHIISISFLQNIINNVPRGEHELTQSDIDCSDRMNVKSAEKLFQPKVISLLEANYPQETKGLVLYLTIMKNVSDAFAPYESLENRIIKMWFNVFVLRIWKHSCSSEKSLKDFITSNVYNCMELNAHMLVNAYRCLRDANKLHLFIPELFSSQPCESFFRCARSLTSTQSTVINFTTMQFLQKIKRIDCMIDLSSKYKEKKNINFDSEVPALTDESIFNLIMTAKEQADEKISALEINNPKEFIRIALENEKKKVKKEKEGTKMENLSLEEIISTDNEDDLIADASGFLEETTGKILLGSEIYSK